MRVGAIDGAANTLGSTEHLLDCAREKAGHTPGSHDASNVEDLIEGDVSIVGN